MFAPAKKVHLTNKDACNLKKGDRVNVDSGLGGSFTVEVENIDNGRVYLFVTNPDHEQRFFIPFAGITHNLYRLEAA